MTLRVSPKVLDWAASQVGRTLREFAARISKRSAEKIAAGHLTATQAMKVARLAGVPFGYLFLDSPPPPRAVSIADLRTVPEAAPLSRDYFQIYDDIEQKQVWYREYLVASGVGERDFVGRFKGKDASPMEVAEDMRRVLGFAGAHLLRLDKPEDLFWALASLSEAAGVLVFKNSVVGNNTRRRLSVSEFRGFCVSDPVAPVVFVNGADAPAAWAFTLAHELAHIWMGHSAISDVAPLSQNAEERFCNAVAAEFLVPRADFLERWIQTPGGTDAKLEQARQHYKVSGLVIALRALHLNLIDETVYRRAYDAARRRKGREASGGDFYFTLAARNSKAFSRCVADLAVSGAITLREAGRLLNTNPNNITTFHAKQRSLSV